MFTIALAIEHARAWPPIYLAFGHPPAVGNIENKHKITTNDSYWYWLAGPPPNGTGETHRPAPADPLALAGLAPVPILQKDCNLAKCITVDWNCQIEPG